MGDYNDRRVARTRAAVLSHAQRMLAEDGAAALTYSALSAATGLSRPTLYRHWPHITDLLHDLVPEGPAPSVSALEGDVRERLLSFLSELREGFGDVRAASTLLSLVPQAERDVTSRNLLRWAMEGQTRALNAGLEGTGLTVSELDAALLVGPIVFRRFVHRAPIPDDLLGDVVDHFLAFRTLSVNQDSSDTGLAW